ncbi:MAG: transketolase C-terminal domain-containing protein [Candidatus Omnitrophica bacterium]|nr:transketolase C-terminal domain-containing protein [Candidatus Omnitrophota bacterium]
MKRMITYREALNEAIIGEMRRDPRVFMYGIDVADHKRTFGSGNGILEEFGNSRCFSTPLSECSMTGLGLGAALSGLRPIHVHMRVDFLILAMNELTNMIASFSYGSCGKMKVPMVIRAVIGRGWGQSWQHSKTLHSWFAHIPGLKVVMPSRPSDAKGMLIAAIRDDNPVIFIEHRWLYDVVGEVPEEALTEPLVGSRVIHSGKDATVLAVSWMNVEALQAAEVLEKHGISLEIIDARSISPFDDTTIIDSIKKTGHLIVADYDWIHCGFGAEVATRVYEKCMRILKSPITRIGFAEAHCPCSRPLEVKFYPSAIDIIRSVEKKLGLSEIDLAQEEFYSYEKKFKGPF